MASLRNARTELLEPNDAGFEIYRPDFFGRLVGATSSRAALVTVRGKDTSAVAAGVLDEELVGRTPDGLGILVPRPSAEVLQARLAGLKSAAPAASIAVAASA